MDSRVPIPFGPYVLRIDRTVIEAALAEAQEQALPPEMSPAPPQQQWMTAEKLAELTGLRAAHLRAQARAGLLEHRRVGRRVLFSATAIEQLQQASR